MNTHTKSSSGGTRSTSSVSGFRVTKPATADRAARFDDLIVQHSAVHSLSPDFVRAVIQAESAFNPWARSPKGAMGLMQLMPDTMKEFHVSNAFDPAENIRGGVAYLKQLLDKYSNNEVLALAAYNAGPGAVDRHGQTVPPYKETQDYVKKIGTITTARTVQPRGQVIYRITEVVDGRDVVRYSDQKPASGTYTLIGR